MISTIEAEIYEQHALEAAFLWSYRDAAVVDPLYDLESLGELDERLEAHVDGLRLAGDAGWEICRGAIDEDDPGSLFAPMVLAVERRDLKGIAEVLDVGGGVPALARAIVSALGWVPFAKMRAILPGLLSHRVGPELYRIGIAACAFHRQDPGAALGYAVLSSNLRLKARALRAVGELGRGDLLEEVRGALGVEDEACRFAAAWSAAILGDRDAGRVLWGIAARGGRFAEQACAMAMRRMEPGVAYTWLYSMAGAGTAAGAGAGARVALAGAAALGDPGVMPWIIECMGTSELARVAGGAFAMITGVDLQEATLRGEAPQGVRSGPSDEPEDEDVSMDLDESLAWPDRERVGEWWKRRGGEFRRGTRYLLGRTMTVEWLEEVLRLGRQPARLGAALELATRRARRGVVEVRGPASRQQGRGLHVSA
ncbi:TIGR02270 family protein [Sorangium sp. So ce1024]|uniref:TIGR02270 family protein n=1 Tax=Sorangium sp. So ce1024 TaxID=3133327 RepID=UPI003F0D0F5B